MSGLLKIICILSVSGCASHGFMRGNVAMKINEKEAHVCLGDGDIKVGDSVTFFENECFDENAIIDSSASGRTIGIDALCELLVVGSGTVTKLLSNHYSLVKTEGNFSFNEGTLVERM